MNPATVIPILVLAISPLPFLGSIRSAYLAAQVAGWPTVEGTLSAVSLEEKEKKDKATFEVKVAYDYVVDGKPYTGDRIAMGYSASIFRETHAEIEQALKKGKTVVVRYDPDQPDRAYLAAGITRANQGE